MSEDTDYKKAYLRERRARDEVESLLEEKTRALYLANQTLERQLEQLKNQQAVLINNERMATLGTLSAGVAHELNNPLAYVAGNLESLNFYISPILQLLETVKLLEQNDLRGGELETRLVDIYLKQRLDEIADDLPELIHDTLHGCERIKAIVNDLMNFSRSNNDSFSSASLKKIIEDTLRLLHGQLKGYELTVAIEDVPNISCKEGALKQAIINLLVNAKYAVDMSHKSHKSIEVLLALGKDQDIILSISDNGVGIDADVLPRLFDPFFTTKPVGEGTGMGLAVTQAIVKEHKGKIEVHSQEGVGSQFTISFPLE
ncbi:MULTISPECIES: sensor histidine kinase [Pseudoalteromonas]|uniref:sensor histidine kinase n=1 Tax=Pseudoalteromonas TaxID=53246 RepID=UPI000FFECC86|nr:MULTISPECIES: ATP-binding protein [Pseudoalteromonas]MCG9758138.1 ATP-binding protein [Pseudoalteromonas sp. Isolate6]NKC18815.1 two-component sensor histidine kinase [Pseudoalteromonas galatheae]RXE87857.1 two-component sensor histidine kinase [Pseudoalteromonas sp. A757]